MRRAGALQAQRADLRVSDIRTVMDVCERRTSKSTGVLVQETSIAVA